MQSVPLDRRFLYVAQGNTSRIASIDLTVDPAVVLPTAAATLAPPPGGSNNTGAYNGVALCADGRYLYASARSAVSWELPPLRRISSHEMKHARACLDGCPVGIAICWCWLCVGYR